jgi:hypothetical protein
MGHGNEFKPSVVNTKNLVAFEIQTTDVAPNLLIMGDIPKTQISIMRPQRQQVRRYPVTVVGAK